jgi:hypothetical protein
VQFVCAWLPRSWHIQTLVTAAVRQEKRSEVFRRNGVVSCIRASNLRLLQGVENLLAFRFVFGSFDEAALIQLF